MLHACAKQEVMFELFDKNWGYGYVTESPGFEALAAQWVGVVNAAADTETFVVT